MKTQDIVCPVCDRMVRGYEPAEFPCEPGEVAQGYTFITPYAHTHPKTEKRCLGSRWPYYVGDGNL